MNYPRLVFSSVSLIVLLYVLVNQGKITDAQPNATVQTIDVGVILDLSTWVGKMTESCVSMALADYYSTHRKTVTRLVLHTRHSHHDIVAAAATAVDLMKTVQVQAILGPQSSSEAEFVVDIGNKAHVPIISFTATSPSISSRKTPYFIRTTLNDSTQVKAIAAIVIYQKFDAVVGDVTILANRSQYVDFTLPFTESGVSMVVPLKTDDRKSAWIFLKPLTRGLWLTTGAAFIVTGLVVWVLEHRTNEGFQGTPTDQVGKVISFTFSTLVLAHKERMDSNLARFVLIIWIFVVLILTSSYTASLTSMLTVQKFQPTVTDINELKKNGDFVGYQKGSFVETGLLMSLGIDRKKVRAYDTIEEYGEALHKGSQKGGVSAIIDEVPYIQLFIGHNCKKYMMVGPTHRTAGFGFAFPKGSPLVSDINRYVLNVTEGERMETIKQAWFGIQEDCADQRGNTITSNSFTLDSFKGLFIIAGVSSGVALITFLAMFLYEHWSTLVSTESFLNKTSTLLSKFMKKDPITDPPAGTNIIYSSGGTNIIYISRGTNIIDSSGGTVNLGKESDEAAKSSIGPQVIGASNTDEHMDQTQQENGVHSIPSTSAANQGSPSEITSAD